MENISITEECSVGQAVLYTLIDLVVVMLIFCPD